MGSFAQRLKKFFGIQHVVSESLFEELTDLLVEGDFGAAGAYKTVETLRSLCKKEKITQAEGVRQSLVKLLEEQLVLSPRPASLEESTGALQVILLLGVNGVGKTTTAAKLAARYQGQQRKPVLAAADTFRAAAIDQLKIHGERLGVRVVAHKHGGDPAAVIYDAIEAARSGGVDLIIADTAGRMHTKSALVEELKKIDRVVEAKAEGSRYVKWLVLDATTGRNALVQAATFHQAVALDGIILTKYDSSAKGGVVFSLAEELKVPVLYLCTGEQYPDIHPFDPHHYVLEFAGLA
ncbi:MAG: signal recognition particle-docking protein FtsY [Spirochaetaceae bacterium]|jgi:fused signal recognition particle receptor|nr:signal recognition particle-docking protein FtsY [Spirochaetaceae bacterium]